MDYEGTDDDTSSDITPLYIESDEEIKPSKPKKRGRPSVPKDIYVKRTSKTLKVKRPLKYVTVPHTKGSKKMVSAVFLEFDTSDSLLIPLQQVAWVCTRDFDATHVTAQTQKDWAKQYISSHKKECDERFRYWVDRGMTLNMA